MRVEGLSLKGRDEDVEGLKVQGLGFKSSGFRMVKSLGFKGERSKDLGV